MYLNSFADSTAPHDMAGSEEFASLLQSAADLGIDHAPQTEYRSANIVLRGMRFHYLDWGNPAHPAIILLHGGHQQAHSWDLVSLNLARHYRVIALDQRGHGDTEWARDADYTGQAMAADAAGFIRAIGFEQPPVVIGHSMGGRNTMLLARNHPDLLRAMVIVDIGPELSERGRTAIAGFVKANEEFDDLEHFIANVRQYDPYRPRAHIERTVKYNMLVRADGKYVSKCDGTLRRLGIRPMAPGDALTLADAAKLDLPALLVRGADSNILAPDAAERFRDALPQGVLVTVPNCGHGVPSQNTPGFLAALHDFLATLQSGGQHVR